MIGITILVRGKIRDSDSHGTQIPCINQTIGSPVTVCAKIKNPPNFENHNTEEIHIGKDLS